MAGPDGLPADATEAGNDVTTDTPGPDGKDSAHVSIASLRAIWWLIQVNAAVWLILVGVLAARDASPAQMSLPVAGLFVAALLEHAGYRLIYHPHLRRRSPTEADSPRPGT